MIQGVPGEDRCIVLVEYEDKIRNMFHNINPGLSRRFPIERPFHFENFTLDQLAQILRLKMRNQDLDVTDAAIRAARDIFERALVRPNFTNAGEVNSALATAKMNYETRQSSTPLNQQTIDSRLDAVDFDSEFDRGERSELDCHGMLHGLVHSSVIDKLASYQKRCLWAKRHELKPTEQVPTNFIFKGFLGTCAMFSNSLFELNRKVHILMKSSTPTWNRITGTGKTTTAQHMGKFFYNRGFLSTSKVIKCSAIDLLAQYMGQTTPKTRKKLEEGFGRVLFIDEAYHLMYGSYAAEAVDELIHFFTQPANVGKLVVILTGFVADMHQLMSLHPTLSGLFPEDIVFDHIPPDNCIRLLVRELERSNVGSENNFLIDTEFEGYVRVKRLFRILALIPAGATCAMSRTWRGKS